jgi:hypothetical protein
MFWIDLKYLGLLSPKLPLYTVKSSNPFLAACRCPLCGDSKKDPLKKRAYFFQQKDKIFYKCHNCGISKSISKLLGELDYLLKKEYDLELFTERNPKAIEVKVLQKTEVVKEDNPLKRIKKISQLHADHPAKQYIVSRKIPYNQHYRLYYTDTFFSWTNSIIPDKFKSTKKDEPRIVIPFFDSNKKMFGYQGRSLNPNAKVRYYTIMFGENEKVFGLDQINFDDHVYVVEGPIDSLFLPNCLAMAGADISPKLLNKEKTTIIFDNEPRNPEILRRMRNYIDQGYTVCIWPNSVKQKDINDMILSGMNINKLLDIISENSYIGLRAQFHYAMWRKT